MTTPRDRRFCEDEIIVLSYLAKYNCKKLSFNSNEGVYRRLKEIFGRKTKSSKAKRENILREYTINGVPKESSSVGTSGTGKNVSTLRETEKSRWSYYITAWSPEEWRDKALSILAREIETESSPETNYIEGKTIERLHRVKERNKKLITDAKEKWSSDANGDIRCAACNFSFLETYGELGKDFIEAHHSVPLSELDGNTSNNIKDLVPLCANCHRMIHRSKGTVTELRDILSGNSSTNTDL